MLENDTGKSRSLFQLASARMDWLSSRQKVIATNIANADSPGYLPKDINTFDDYLTQGQIETKAAGSSWDQTLDGNRVVLEEQTLLASETEENHRLAARLYRKGYDLLAIAVSK